MATPIAQNTHPSNLPHLLAGSLSGLLSCILVHPLDVLRTRMQIYNGAANLYNGVYNGIITIIKKEGYRSLYRGVIPAVVGSGLSWGLFMYFYNITKLNNSTYFYNASTNHFVSAAQAGMITSILTNPIWIVKTRLEVQKNNTILPYTGLVNCMRRMVTEEGILSLYKGLLPSLMLCSHGAIQFAVYESLKANKILSDQIFLSAAVSKIAATCITFPLSTIRARLHIDKNESYITDFFKVGKNIYIKEGIKGYFKGLTPNLIRVVPHSALMIFLYEWIYKALS